ncbi:hydroxyacid dehydrogenase, partial [Azotobacter beijerinckii]|nr:hydroxyacid dehydrogenase [Azotobacter beijerinckii]
MTLFTELQRLLGAAQVQDSAQAEALLRDRHGRFVGRVAAAVHPRDTAEVAAVVRL